MAVTIANTRFPYHAYDARADTLFVSVDGPRLTVPEEVFDTPEGHIVEYDNGGQLVAIELMEVRKRLDRDGQLRISLPEKPAIANPGELAAALD
jgi:uncharacterized protein YuzE